MTITMKLTTFDRDNRIGDDVRFALGQLAIAIKRQPDVVAAQCIDRAMSSVERAQSALAGNDTD